MIIGDRLRALREEKNMSQGDIEKATGLLRCYISRVENGHTVPALETVEKLARALDVPLHHVFYEGDTPPTEIPANIRAMARAKQSPRAQRDLQRFASRIARIAAPLDTRDRTLISSMASQIARQRSRHVGARAK